MSTTIKSSMLIRHTMVLHTGLLEHGSFNPNKSECVEDQQQKWLHYITSRENLRMDHIKRVNSSFILLAVTNLAGAKYDDEEDDNGDRHVPG